VVVVGAAEAALSLRIAPYVTRSMICLKVLFEPRTGSAEICGGMGGVAFVSRCMHERFKPSLLICTIAKNYSMATIPATFSPNRTSYSAQDIVEDVWNALGLPAVPVDLPSVGPGLPSSFKVAQLAQASIALSALAAALIHHRLNRVPFPKVTVPLDHACVEFRSERFWTLDGVPPARKVSAIGGLHETSDGYVRIHDGFQHHRAAALKLIGCLLDASRETIDDRLRACSAVDLENKSFEAGAVIAALRSFEQWDTMPQAAEMSSHCPVLIKKIASGEPTWGSLKEGSSKSLNGLKVVEMSRVIAAPTAGRALAAHGADSLWITSPNLPDQPALDRDFARGKRTVRLDVNSPEDLNTVSRLLEDADVFLQGYRPGSLAAKGLDPELLASHSKHGIIVANLSAYGPTGPWASRRGFDSIVQTLSGINVAEAGSFGAGEASRVLPCQALDHASGYFLAFGIMVALARRAEDGGSYSVDVSLAGTMKYLRTLGQIEGKAGFSCEEYGAREEVPDAFFETRETAFGMLRAIRHSAHIEGVDVGYHHMPKPLGSDEARWL
jgi:hypothetical protein